MITSLLMKKAVAVFIMLSGAAGIVLGLFVWDAALFLKHFFAAATGLFIMIYFLFCGAYYLYKRGSSFSPYLLNSALIVMTIHFSFAGWAFENYAGMYLAADFHFIPQVTFDVQFDFFRLLFSNGRVLSGRTYVGINFIPVIVLAVINFQESKERKERERAALLEGPDPANLF